MTLGPVPPRSSLSLRAILFVQRGEQRRQDTSEFRKLFCGYDDKVCLSYLPMDRFWTTYSLIGPTHKQPKPWKVESTSTASARAVSDPPKAVTCCPTEHRNVTQILWRIQALCLIGGYSLKGILEDDFLYQASWGWMNVKEVTVSENWYQKPSLRSSVWCKERIFSLRAA